MFSVGDKVWAPHPDGEGEVRGVVVGRGEPGNAIEVEGRLRDVAFVQYEDESDLDGTVGKVPYSKLRARDG